MSAIALTILTAIIGTVSLGLQDLAEPEDVEDAVQDAIIRKFRTFD
jgi:hypothetical protein